MNTLWPLLGISNQLLAAIALCVGTMVIIRMGRVRYAWMTLLPLTWLVVVTMSAGWARLFAPDPRLGFLANARFLRDAIATNTLPAGIASADVAHRMVLNNHIDAAMAAFFMIAVVVILADSIRQCGACSVAAGRR